MLGCGAVCWSLGMVVCGGLWPSLWSGRVVELGRAWIGGGVFFAAAIALWVLSFSAVFVCCVGWWCGTVVGVAGHCLGFVVAGLRRLTLSVGPGMCSCGLGWIRTFLVCGVGAIDVAGLVLVVLFRCGAWVSRFVCPCGRSLFRCLVRQSLWLCLCLVRWVRGTWGGAFGAVRGWPGAGARVRSVFRRRGVRWGSRF